MLENTIISNLLFNEEYLRKVFPYIKEEYFDETTHKKIFSTFSEYVDKYNSPPSIEALKISIDNRKDLNESSYKEICKSIDELQYDKTTNQDWLVDETEKFCQNKDLYNSIRRAILILDGQDKNHDKGAIPKLLSDSLGISFETNIGHDFLEDFEGRYEFYHRVEERIPFDLEIFNKITKGGLPKKSLTVFLAETGVGKTIVMCHMAAAALMQAKNVLYITLEMAEERIAERIDANLMDITIDELKNLPKPIFEKKLSKVKSKTTGKLIIKEYPTGSAHSAHFRHMLNELKLKKNFQPDIVFVDYLNLCTSFRVKNSAANSYTIVKSIAEELRGLAMEFNIPMVSATQANRSAYGNSDIDLSNTSESIGLPATVDAMFALISTEELEERKQLMIKQLKNRWGDLSYYKRFVIGIDRSKMKLYDLEEDAQKKVHSESRSDNDKPVFDKSSFAEEWDDVPSKRSKKIKVMEDIL
jgi:replicative DNA helicase